ncbi:MAG: hypothetical protein IJ467_04995 [Bacteroidaceae bacterium]|nr:hypothetical protein [Bacteroidaceae bacterium]
MKKVFLSFALLAGVLCGVAQNSYLVKTADARGENQQKGVSLSPEVEFVSSNFKYYSLCDWFPGMKFMVMPESIDLIVSTFKLASSGKSVGSGELKHRIMEYQGVETTERGAIHFKFLCDSVEYYCEVKNTTLADYCSNPKKGIKTLAYLGDVDIANALLVGRELFTRGERYYQDDANAANGYREVKLPKNTKVTVTAVGVGSKRAFPVKIVFEDSKGVSYYKEVAISKTNSGMLDNEFIMNKADCTFGKAFGFTDPNKSRQEQLNARYANLLVYLKHNSSMMSGGKEQQVNRYTQYTIKEVSVENGSNYVTMTLVDKRGRLFTKKVTFLRESVTGDVHESENYFNEVFGVGDLRKLYPAISESVWSRIEKGEATIGMTMQECRLALGEPMRTYKDTMTGVQDWIYENRVILSFKEGKVITIK